LKDVRQIFVDGGLVPFCLDFMRNHPNSATAVTFAAKALNSLTVEGFFFSLFLQH
jgi:hypothetical protein